MRAPADERGSLLFWHVALAIGVLGGWEWASAAGAIDPFFFSQPSAIVLRVAEWVRTGTIWAHAATTIAEALLSFAIGGLLGVVVGFALAAAPTAASLFEPYIRIANALPRVVLAPVFLLWFGLGIWSKVALGVTVVFFVVFYNTYRGVRDVDRSLIDNARMLGASETQLTWHVLVPSALTWILSSLQISVGMAIVAVVVGEYLGASKGIGYVIAQAEGVFDTTGVFAGIVVLAAGVLGVGWIVTRIERRVLRWKPQYADTFTGQSP